MNEWMSNLNFESNIYLKRVIQNEIIVEFLLLNILLSNCAPTSSLNVFCYIYYC